MFRKEKHGVEARSEFPEKARVSGEPLDVAFIAAIHEDGARPARPGPEIGVDKEPLRESPGVTETEVIEPLGYVLGLVLVRILGWLLVGEFAD